MKITARRLINSQSDRDRKLRRARADFNEQLEYTTIKVALEWWKINLEESASILPETINDHYTYVMTLISSGIIRETWDIGTLNHNHRYISDQFEKSNLWSQAEKSKLINALISFINFLNQQSHGTFRKFQPPSKIKLNNQIRANSPSALTLQEWWRFRDELEKISIRDALVAKLLSYTARPLNEILKLKIADLDFSKNLVVIFKTKGVPTKVQLDASVREQMKKYLEQSKSYRKNGTDLLFVTNQGNSIYRTHFTQTFKKAALNADLGFNVTAKMIQWSHASDLLLRMQLTKEHVKEILNIKQLPKNLELSK